jgi:hypothetical protein
LLKPFVPAFGEVAELLISWSFECGRYAVFGCAARLRQGSDMEKAA